LKERKTLLKREIYAIAFIAGMNFSNLVQFMVSCGHSFQPDDKLDLCVIDYYQNEYCKDDTIVTFASICFEKTEIYITEGITKDDEDDEE
jgi:hypothetical protein